MSHFVFGERTPERTPDATECLSAALSSPHCFLPLSLKGLFPSSCSHILPSSLHFLSAIFFSCFLIQAQLPSGKAALSTGPHLQEMACLCSQVIIVLCSRSVWVIMVPTRTEQKHVKVSAVPEGIPCCLCTIHGLKWQKHKSKCLHAMSLFSALVLSCSTQWSTVSKEITPWKTEKKYSYVFGKCFILIRITMNHTIDPGTFEVVILLKQKEN